MKKNILKIFIFFIIFAFLPALARAAELPIGSECQSNSDCASGDCEKSTKTGTNGVPIYYCDCAELDVPAYTDSSESCAKEYGGDPADWTCRDGSNMTYDLDYCEGNKTGKKMPPLPELKKTSIFESAVDAVLDNSMMGTTNEIDKIIQQPQLKIKIPGMSFTSPEDAAKLTREQITIEGTKKFLSIPFLGEYIKAAYKYAVVVVSIIAVIMIMNQGFGIITSGGSSEAINKAKTRIGQAVTGLLVAIGSYVILYAINPDLVNFRNLEVVYIEREEMPEAPDSGVDCNVAGECEPATHLFDNTKIIINKGLVPCDYPEENGLVKIPDTAGIKYLKKDQNNYIRPELVQPLIKAGQVAASEGYTIGISTSCRPFSSQVKAAEKNKAGVQAGTVAKAGKSPHGYGYALDIHLIKNGRDFAAGYVVVNGKKQSMNIFGVPENMAQGNQCVLAKADPDVLAAIKKQSEILFKAGFTRLTLESWHYEYGTANRYCRAQCTGLSVLCGEATDCPLKVNGCKN